MARVYHEPLLSKPLLNNTGRPHSFGEDTEEAMAKNAKRPVETLAPTRNFTITLGDKMRAAGGPTAYMTRRRTIEDLEDELITMVAALVASNDPNAIAAGLARSPIVRRLARLNTLIETHNRYYPSEANLPMDPSTGHMLERGARWQPLDAVTTDSLVARARALACGACGA